MKRVLFTLLILFVYNISAQAQMGAKEDKSASSMQMMGQGQQMPMMMHNMMYEMMQTMMEMMNMQEQMIKTPNAAQKKQMMKDISKMKGKMGKMMSMCKDMMMGMDDPQMKLKCAQEWLKKAIDLHDVHIKDPKTATEASQMEMMDQMKKAYECITGGGKSSLMKTEGHEPKKDEPKTDSHKH